MNLPTWAGAEMIRMEDEGPIDFGPRRSKDAEIARLRAALMAIAEMGDKTLLGGADCRDEEHAHQVGANKAFQQCADMARQALRRESGDE